MHLASALPLTLLLVAPERGTALRFAPAEGLVLRRTFTAQSSLEGGDLEVVMDDQEVPGEYLPDLEVLVGGEARVVLSDRVERAADGRPLAFVRRFEELEEELREETAMFGLEGFGDTEDTVDLRGSSDLEGEAVRFAWDADDGAYACEWADEDDAGDPNLLEGLVDDVDLRGLLPEGEVEVGASWTADGAALAPLFFPGGDLHWSYDGPGSEAWEAPPTELTVEGQLELRLTGFHDADGRRVADLAIEGEVTVTVVRPSNLDRVPVVDGAATETLTKVHTLEGELGWDVAGGHLAELKLTSQVEASVQLVRDPNEPGGSFESVVRMEGEATFAIAVEREE